MLLLLLVILCFLAPDYLIVFPWILACLLLCNLEPQQR